MSLQLTLIHVLCWLWWYLHVHHCLCRTSGYCLTTLLFINVEFLSSSIHFLHIFSFLIDCYSPKHCMNIYSDFKKLIKQYANEFGFVFRKWCWTDPLLSRLRLLWRYLNFVYKFLLFCYSVCDFMPKLARMCTYFYKLISSAYLMRCHTYLINCFMHYAPVVSLIPVA